MSDIKKSNNTRFRRAFSFLIPLCMFAVFISCAIISVGNDMYAFSKPEKEMTVIIDNPRTIKEFSAILEENGIIENPYVFEKYVTYKGKRELVEGFSGKLPLNSAMSYREILQAIKGTYSLKSENKKTNKSE